MTVPEVLDFDDGVGLHRGDILGGHIIIACTIGDDEVRVRLWDGEEVWYDFEIGQGATRQWRRRT